MLFNHKSPLINHIESSSPLDRRGVLGALSLASVGLIATSSVAKAISFNSKGAMPNVSVQTASRTSARPAGTIDLTALPPQWAHSQGSLLPEYTRYLATLKLQRISPKQVIEAHAKTKGSIWNILPPKAWWARMGYTLRVADRIALEMNASEVEIVSAYRSPAYNSHCDGAASGSWHQANVAVDVKFPMAASQVTSASRNLRDRGLFKGGVGGYYDFTHIDTRGHNVNWQG
jgi:hypothetical protein